MTCSILDETFKPCRSYQCRHNMFAEDVVRGGPRMPDGGKVPRLKRNVTPMARKYCNCMLLLKITQEDFTLEEIAAMYGLTPWGVDRIAKRAMKKLLAEHRALLSELNHH